MVLILYRIERNPMNMFVVSVDFFRGVGIVKLMGRDSGFVAMHAATAADVVNLCMIPEVKVDMKEMVRENGLGLVDTIYIVFFFFVDISEIFGLAIVFW